MLHIFICVIKMLYLPASQQILLANAKTGPFILVMIYYIPIKFEILAKIYYTILVLRILIFISITLRYIETWFYIQPYTIYQRSNFIFKNNE